MKKKVFITILPISLLMLIALIILVGLSTNNIAYASDEISPYTIERGSLYYNPYCDLDNGFVPKLPIEMVNDVNGKIINITEVHMDVVYNNSTSSTVYTYAKPKQHIKYNTYTYVSDCVERITFLGQNYTYDCKFYTNSDIVDDSYSGSIHGVGQAKQRLGKGALFYRVREFVNSSWSDWTHIYNLFGTNNTVYLNFKITSPCDIEMVNVYELKSTKNGKDYYYNLRQEFDIHFRNNDYNLFIVEEDTNSTLSRTSGNTSYTDKGFKILKDAFKTISVKKDSGNYITYSGDQLDKKSFVENGVYQIKYTQDSLTYYQTVVVDKREPSINIGGVECNKAYNRLMQINGVPYKCFSSKNAVALTWDDNTNEVPISVSKLVNGKYVSIENGEKLNLGNYVIRISKKYTHDTVSFDYYIKIDDFQPNYNYKLLLNGDAYTNKTNRYKTKYYGVKLGGVNYGFSTKQAALEKGLDYERTNFVTQNGSSYQYRGKTYANNTTLTSAMNAYVMANYYFENRDLTSNAQTVLQSNLKDDRLYLNGFQFTYNSNPVYSNSVRVLKATDKYTSLDADVKSILRDTANKSVKNLMYSKTVDSQLTESGKYYIRETNIFGNEHFYEAYYVASNVTSADISYYDANGILKTGSITSESTNLSGVTSLHISNIRNAFDQYATIKITNTAKTANKILVVGDQYILTEEGTYTLLFIDRNGKQFTKTVTITNPNFVLNGVENSGTANNDVTISLKSGYTVVAFVDGGESLSEEVFKLNSKTQRYEYILRQGAVEKDVVLIVIYGNETLQIGFSMTAK